MSEVFGNQGLVLAPEGEILVDRAGLWTATCLYTVPKDRLDLVPALGSPHPHAPFLWLESLRLRFTPGLWKVFAAYAGVQQDETEPVYDFNPGTGNEPIETIDNFVSAVAGSPSSPINGAIFRDPATGDISTDDAVGVFDRFSIMKDGAQNPWAGLQEYLAVNNTTWTKSWTRRSKPSGAARPLTVTTNPAGNPPSFDGANYNWLQFPVAFSQRGSAYECRQVWMLSGPRGWNRVVYDGAETP